VIIYFSACPGGVVGLSINDKKHKPDFAQKVATLFWREPSIKTQTTELN